MAKIVEINKCPNCAGKLEKDKEKKIYYCPSCGSEFEMADIEDEEEQVEEKPKSKKKADAGFKKPEWFDYEVGFEELITGHDTKEVMHEFAYCTNELGSSEAIISHIRKDLKTSAVFVPGANDDKIKAFIKKMKLTIDKDEKIIFYVNTGLFSSGKKGFLLTDKKVIFSGKKPRILPYAELECVVFEMEDDFPNIYINGEKAMTIYSISGPNEKPLGAFPSLICAFAAEQNNGQKIAISKYDSPFDDDDEDEDEDDDE